MNFIPCFDTEITHVVDIRLYEVFIVYRQCYTWWGWSAWSYRHHQPWYWLPWASYQIRKIAGCACAGNAGYVFPSRRIQRKPLVSDPGMPHGTCVTHVPWGMSGSLTCGDGENVPGIPGACAPAILRIWQKVHVLEYSSSNTGRIMKNLLNLSGSITACECKYSWHIKGAL